LLHLDAARRHVWRASGASPPIVLHLERGEELLRSEANPGPDINPGDETGG
jgi:hypothetical protein